MKLLESLVAEWKRSHKPSILTKLSENQQKADADKERAPSLKAKPDEPEIE